MKSIVSTLFLMILFCQWSYSQSRNQMYNYEVLKVDVRRGINYTLQVENRNYQAIELSRTIEKSLELESPKSWKKFYIRDKQFNYVDFEELDDEWDLKVLIREINEITSNDLKIVLGTDTITSVEWIKGPPLRADFSPNYDRRLYDDRRGENHYSTWNYDLYRLNFSGGTNGSQRMYVCLSRQDKDDSFLVLFSRNNTRVYYAVRNQIGDKFYKKEFIGNYTEDYGITYLMPGPFHVASTNPDAPKQVLLFSLDGI